MQCKGFGKINKFQKEDTLIWKLKLALTGSIKPKQPKHCIHLVRFAIGFLNTVKAHK